FGAAMGSIVWQRAHARALLDEIPAAYKDIKVVMDDQRDLAEVLHELRPILNYKGVG
ncbi:MAG: RtcB family protein, partial [Actinomycetota bacterium]